MEERGGNNLSSFFTFMRNIMDNKKSDIINKRKYHHPKAVVKGKDGKVINILENNHTKEKNSEKEI